MAIDFDKDSLVDDLGGFNRAIEVTKKMAHLAVRPHLIEVGRAKKPLWERLSRRFINSFEPFEGGLALGWDSIVFDAEGVSDEKVNK